MKRPLFSLLVSVIAVSALQAQPQKQINLGGGFVLNTKIPLEMADQPLNNLFPVEMNKQTPFLSVMNTSEQQKQQEERPAKKEQVRTICGEWVAKDENLISVYEGKDWYIQKSSSCAQEYYSQWKKQQNLSFIQEKQKRLQCEQQLKNTPSAVAMPICPICGKPIDARCGAVAVLLDDNGKKQYTHADCKAKNRFDRQSYQLKEILGINEDNATPIPLTETSAYLSQQAKDNAVAKLKEISISAAQAAPTKVTQEDINAFIAKYGKKLNKAGEKQRKGIALSADDQKLVAQFEALHHAYNAANEAISLPEDLSAEDYVPAPSKRQQKTFLPDAITPQASVQKQAAAIQPLAPAGLTADNLPASAVPDVSLPKPQQAPALVAQLEHSRHRGVISHAAAVNCLFFHCKPLGGGLHHGHCRQRQYHCPFVHVLCFYSFPAAVLLRRHGLFLHLDCCRGSRGAVFRSVCAAGGAGSGLVLPRPVDIIDCLKNVRSLGEAVEEVVRPVVLRRAINAAAVAAELLQRLHAGRAAVGHLHEVEVAVGADGDAHRHTAADAKLGGVRNDFPLDTDSGRGRLD